MTRKLFGTDGIRGRANAEPVTPETALKVAMAAGAVFTRGDHRHTVVIGKDTRLSGYMLEPALTAGFTAVGMDVVLVGPIPTPAVGMLTRSLRADLGVMISASHNPYHDNGIKLFGPDGYKLSDEVERRIEAHVENGMSELLAAPGELGRARHLEDARGRYIEFVKASLPRGLRLDGLKIVVDCAQGAAYRVAPAVLYELGAEVVPLSVQPSGFNINEGCGATQPALMQEKVREVGADLGIALDGDADRLILADEAGRVIDGDQVMGLIALARQADGTLAGEGIVGTVMSNLGLERRLATAGIDFERVPVGDRCVVEGMRRLGRNVGGEQSGHIILSDYATTGDGLIAALQVLGVLVDRGLPASEALAVFEPLPQILRNVRFDGGQPLEDERVKRLIREGEEALSPAGRLLIRKSGTEPLIRVMGEAEDEGRLSEVVDRIVAGIDEVANGRSATAGASGVAEPPRVLAAGSRQ